MSMGDLLREGGFAEETLAMDRRRKGIEAAQVKAQAEKPRTTECPQCGAILPNSIQDVNLVPTDHLRAIVRIRRQRDRDRARMMKQLKGAS